MTARASQEPPLLSWLPALLIAAVAWGSSFLFIKVGLEGFSPSQVGLGRVVVGFTVLAAWCAITRDWPRLTWKRTCALLVVALCMSGAPFILFPLAQQHVTSILASLLNAATPLWTALFVAMFLPLERATRVQVLGLGVGVVGIAVLLGAWNVHEFSALGAVLILAATAFYGIGAVMSRLLLRSSTESNVALVTAQIGLSIPWLLPFALAEGAPDASVWAWDSRALWAIVGLGVLGTSVSYVMFWKVVRVKGATTASSVTYISPLVATVLGVSVLGEQLHWYEPVGAVIVLAGVWLAQRKKRPTEVAVAKEAVE